MLLAPENHARRWRALKGREAVLDLRGERAAQKVALAALLDLAETLADDTYRAEVYLLQTAFAAVQGDYRTALSLADAASAAARQVNNLTLDMRALAYKAQTLTFFGELVKARQVIEETLTRLHQVEDDAVRALVLTVAAHHYMESGDLVRSVQHQNQSVEAARQARNHTLEITINANLGLIYATLGLYGQAQAALEAGLARAEAFGDRRLHATTLCYLGYVYWRNADKDLARQMAERALNELTVTDEAYGEATCRAYLGYILEVAGDLALAADYLAQARAGFVRIGVKPDQIEAQAVAARVALAQARRTEARQLANEVWSYLHENGSQGLSSPSLAYVGVADVFEATDEDEPASTVRAVIEAGYRDLMQRAEKISRADWRRSFLENVVENRALIEKWQQLS
ncbi:MAG: tetratricopeptide repeat protein [Chloroflexi bacterium]|nr:tetratricopeptide repeat protein [Chloroflexota bacterium]